MKKILLMIAFLSLLSGLVSCTCGDCGASSTREYKVKDLKTGAAGFTSLDTRFKVGDTVLNSDKTPVIITDTIATP